MSNLAIKFENISKQYRLGSIGTGTLSHDLNRWWTMNVLRKEDPFLKIGSVNDRSTKDDSGFAWALKNIDLEIKQGEILGIIGKNGAGKSTLLKILSRVTTPSTGKITSYGRMASLLEVGTGFHLEMTGRENIFMNGAIMGMTKVEIRRKMDEIVDFAGIERYVDTPVKRYSSGMIVRLGFAIAAHMEPEILIVDEVLAVGDAEFQKKAIGKMHNISQEGDRTVLFVSHNMAAVRSLCKNALILENGSISYFGDVVSTIAQYSRWFENELVQKVTITENHRKYHCTQEIQIISIELLNDLKIATNEPIMLKVKLKRNNSKVFKSRLIGMINNEFKNRVGLFFSETFELSQQRIIHEIDIKINNHNLSKGYYSVDFNVGIGDHTSALTEYDVVYETIKFKIDYDDFQTKTPILKWSLDWGNNCYKDVETNII